MTRHPDWAHYHRNASSRTYHEAQVSLPFSIAVAPQEGQALLKQYSDANIANPIIKRIASRVEFVVDKRLPRGVSCNMTIEMNGGQRYSSQVDYPKGSIENPLSDAELLAKFMSLAAPAIGAKRATRLAEIVERIEHCANVRSLMKLTAPVARR